MTRRDKWLKPARPSVAKYWAYKDALHEFISESDVEWTPLTIQFMIKMPKSWSKKKKNEMCWKPHTAKPDTDNLIKAFKDCLLKEDSAVWYYGHVAKLWGANDCIIVNFQPCDPIALCQRLTSSSS